MSVFFRQQPHLTLAQLAHAWAPEVDPRDPDAVNRLAHILKLDIANGLFDAVAGKPGFSIVMAGGLSGAINGRNAVEFLQAKLASDYIVVTKEAALDFARRRGLPAPSW